MKRLSFPTCVLCSILVVLPSRSAASSYCPGCVGAIAGVGIGLVAAVGVGIYYIHRSHTSLTGCIQQSDNGLSLAAKDGNYQLENAPAAVTARKRYLLRGHKIKAASGRAFRVDHISHDYGSCGT